MDVAYGHRSSSISADQSMMLEGVQILHTPPQVFGAYAADGSPIPPTLSGPIFKPEHLGLLGEESPNEAKRRRISKVRQVSITRHIGLDLSVAGLRYVSEEEDQVRWKDAILRPLSEFQHRMCLYARREEEGCPKSVRMLVFIRLHHFSLRDSPSAIPSMSRLWRIG